MDGALLMPQAGVQQKGASMNVRTAPLFAVLPALACWPIHAHAEPRSTGSLSAELRDPENALNAFHQALQAGERNGALAILAEDALIYEAGHAERKSEYATHHLDADIAFAKKVPGKTLKRSGGLTGGVAWLTTEGRVTGNYRGKAVDRRTVETALLRLAKGKWMIVHLHWSSAAAQ